ncbi:hypothetical protein RB2519 [Rhodopirellula baltica SH 1]|uniref:Uncharacterized protein n=1 Tax=Rhodopirellula baltica (strain DSM 10527 / NCIMB 13988 / SH1) TaxID=243090 RepID=Q7UVN2_RHOBA|nr:hypothetical protein RB2519 [Rhodopirellula baltica SH 1]
MLTRRVMKEGCLADRFVDLVVNDVSMPVGWALLPVRVLDVGHGVGFSNSGESGYRIRGSALLTWRVATAGGGRG